MKIIGEGPKPASPAARALGCICPEPKDVPQEELPPMPQGFIPGSAVLMHPECPVHREMVKQLIDMAKQGTKELLLDGEGKVVEDRDLVDRIIQVLKTSGLPPCPQVTNALLSLATSLAVGFDQDKDEWMKLCDHVYDFCVAEKARMLAGRAN